VSIKSQFLDMRVSHMSIKSLFLDTSKHDKRMQAQQDKLIEGE
jgi:hypothetical protein